MIKGHLQEKSGYYYMVFRYKDENNKWQSKWKSTGLAIKGNKKRAEEMLRNKSLSFEQDLPKLKSNDGDMLFSDYMKSWLVSQKHNVEATTYSGYNYIISSIICPYFDKKAITLTELKPKDISDFFVAIRKERNVKGQTLQRYHANIRRALQEAVKMDMIDSNPADKIARPKAEEHQVEYLGKDALNELFVACKGAKIELPILIAAFYGLRRGEIAGLKWNAIDFENDMISVLHTVSPAVVDGKRQLVAKDRAKTKSSIRSLPLVADFKKLLIEHKSKQERNKKTYGNSYSKQYKGYVFTNEFGEILKPDYLSDNLGLVIEKNNLKKVTFHSLRHSCASLLLANGVSMKQIQEWLGHSNFSTTANLYTHLDANAKKDSAEKMLGAGLQLCM